MKKNYGFTIIELLITVAVAGTMLALGVPAFSDWVKMNRMVTQTNSIISTLQLARSESVVRSEDIRIQPLTAGTNWSGGWQVIQVSDGSVIRVFDAVEGSTFTSEVNTITFSDDGSATSDPVDADNILLTLRADTCDGDYQRFIRIPRSGVFRLHDDYACSASAP